MRWQLEKRLVLAGFVAAVLILVFVEWECHRDTVRVAEAAEARKSSYEVRGILDKTMVRLVDAETGQRGYLLTGDETYLEPYREAIRNLDEVMGNLKNLTSDNPNQQKHIQALQPLIEKKLAELQQTIELRKKEGLAGANQVVLGGQGKYWMDQIRAVLEEMKSEESDTRNIRTEELKEALQRNQRTVTGGNLLSILLILSVFAYLLRQLSKRRQAEQALTRSEKWFSTTLASIGDAVIATDINGAVTFLNPVAQSLTGWTMEDARGKSMDLVFDIVNAETRRPVENPVKKVFREGKVVGLADHTLLLSKDGRAFDIEDSAAPIVTNAGEGLGVVLVFRDITERKRTEDETSRQRELLELILGSVGDGVVVADSHGKFLLFNASAEQVLGMGATDASPNQWSGQYGTYLPDAVTPYPSSELPLARAIRGESVEQAEVFIRNSKVPDGRLLTITGRHLRTADGDLRGGVVVFHDITDRKRVEKELRQSEERYHLFFDSNPHPVWVYDVKTLAILDVNHSAVRNYGYSREEFTSLTIKDIRPSEDIPALIESASKAPLDTETAGVWKHRKRDGTLIDVEITSHPLVYGGRDARLVVATDVTTRKRAEEALRQSEERFRLLVSEVTDYAILMLDPEGHIANWNAGAERIKGYKAQEIIGQHFSRFYPTEDVERGKPADELKIAAEEGRLEDEGWRVRKDGSRFWANVVITALRDGSGRLLGFAKVTRDITEHKRTQELIMYAKEEAERASNFKDQFLSTMSQELRTPLNAVLGFSDLLADERYGALNDRQQRYVSHIHTGGKHLLRLISDILDLSKIEAGRMELTIEDVEVENAFSEVLSSLQPLADKKSQTLVQQVEPDLQVHADATRFKQVLMNLIGNAIKFTPEGGHIEIAARQMDQQVKVEVRDNGPGIPADEQQRIFEAFVRLTESGTATEGTGLGLAITARLVELHGSKLKVESLPGAGTCFYFALPIVTVISERVAQTNTAGPRTAGAPRILIVEDNVATGQLIQSQLASSGYETLRCDRPERAVDMAREFQPDAITLDMLMKPVHGLEVLRQLKNDARTSKIPVIVVTIADQPAVGSALGADEYLLKPVDKATLLAAVERCLHSRGHAAPARAILVVEDDVATREMIVELVTVHGYAVNTASDGAEARASVARSLPELVILDLVLPKMSGFDLLAEWRANPRTSELSVFVLTSKDLSKDEEKYVLAHAESLFRKQNSWREPLIKQLERVVTSMPAPVEDA